MSDRINASLPLSATMSEAPFTTVLIGTARLVGWYVHHDRPARTHSGRWATNVQGDTGFPDLVLAHRSRGLVVAELKSHTGRLEPGQAEWLDRFARAGIPTFLWRPEHWLGTIVPVLNGEEGVGEGRWVP